MSTSSASRVAAPASNLLISSRSTSSDSNRSSWLCSSSTDRPPAASSSARASKSRSAAILMVDSGVRSSCETSETNCRCTLDSSSSSRSLPCRLAAISLNDVASAARSSTPCTCIRSPRCPADTRWAAWAACRTGSTTHRVTSDAIAASSTTSGQAHADQDALHQQQGGLLLGEREHVVQLVVSTERDADGQGGHRGARVVDQRGRLVDRRGGVLVVELLALLLVRSPWRSGSAGSSR